MKASYRQRTGRGLAHLVMNRPSFRPTGIRTALGAARGGAGKGVADGWGWLRATKPDIQTAKWSAECCHSQTDTIELLGE